MSEEIEFSGFPYWALDQRDNRNFLDWNPVLTFGTVPYWALDQRHNRNFLDWTPVLTFGILLRHASSGMYINKGWDKKSEPKNKMLPIYPDLQPAKSFKIKILESVAC